MKDVVIIGAGVSGCAIARELSRYRMNVCVVEKEGDVCGGTSKANSGIVHAGYDAKAGSLMAQMNVQGNAMMEDLCEQLDVPFERKGSLVVCVEDSRRSEIQRLYENGMKNGVPGLQILERQEVLALEPNVSDAVVCALFAPSAGIVCPFQLNIAMAECAFENGVEFQLNTTVTSVYRKKSAESIWVVETTKGILETRYVVNAAGVYADVFHNMVSDRKLHITPRRGEYMLLDKAAGTQVVRTVFSLPDLKGKGVLVTPTVHHNLLIGPTAIETEDREDTRTTKEGLSQIIKKCGVSVKEVPLGQVITSFSGLRAHEDGHEFLIEEVADAKGFVDCAGIESPGLSSCPAIGKRVADLIQGHLKRENNQNFKVGRTPVTHPEQMTLEERNQLISKEPSYGTIVCRCESISEGEIIEAIQRPLGAKTLDGVKRRTRAGMGRCQAGFCTAKTMEILSREWKIPMESITKSGGHSNFLEGKNKQITGEDKQV